MTGYRSLCRLVSAANLAGTKGVPRFRHALLEQHTEGLVALSGCRHGEVGRRLMAGDREGAMAAARRLAKLYPLHIELQHHLLPDDDFLVAALPGVTSVDIEMTAQVRSTRRRRWGRRRSRA